MVRCFVLMVVSLISFSWSVTLAEYDLLHATLKPSSDLMIYPSDSSKRVWNKVFWGSTEVTIDGDGFSSTKAPSLFARITRLLLILVITLSVTMILYNWVKYIVKVWQWEDSKDLIKNVAYIVIWILVSLFSVLIITLLRSVPETLDKDLKTSQGNEVDKDAILWVKD